MKLRPKDYQMRRDATATPGMATVIENASEAQDQTQPAVESIIDQSHDGEDAPMIEE